MAIRSTGWARSTGTYTPPALTTAHHDDHQLRGPIHRDADGTLGADSGADQLARQPRRPLVEFAVGQPRAPSITATASGSAATAAASSCGATPTGAPTPAPDQPDSTSSRSSRPSTSIDDNRRVGSAVIETSTRWSRSTIAAMPSVVEHVGVVFDAQADLAPGKGFHRQRVVVVLAVGELGDRQAVDAERRRGVDRVVLVDEQGVEELVVAGDPVNLVERQVLMLEQLVVGALQLLQQTRRWWWSA